MRLSAVPVCVLALGLAAPAEAKEVVVYVCGKDLCRVAPDGSQRQRLTRDGARTGRRSRGPAGGSRTARATAVLHHRAGGGDGGARGADRSGAGRAARRHAVRRRDLARREAVAWLSCASTSSSTRSTTGATPRFDGSGIEQVAAERRPAPRGVLRHPPDPPRRADSVEARPEAEDPRPLPQARALRTRSRSRTARAATTARRRRSTGPPSPARLARRQAARRHRLPDRRADRQQRRAAGSAAAVRRRQRAADRGAAHDRRERPLPELLTHGGRGRSSSARARFARSAQAGLPAPARREGRPADLGTLGPGSRSSRRPSSASSSSE